MGLGRSPSGSAAKPLSDSGVDHRAALHQAKLRALVAREWGDGPDEAVAGFPGGAVLRRGSTAYVLAEENPARSLGPALVWARRHEMAALHLLATDSAGALARRAAQFATPISVWSIEGTEVRPVDADRPVEAQKPPSDLEVFVDVIEAAGAEPVYEGGILMAEILGLEVGRVVREGDHLRFEVGVGKHDRWAQREAYGERDVLGALTEAVAFVRTKRVPGGAHPFAQLARERWLRHVLVARPDLVGCVQLEPMASPVLRPDLRTAAPAPATGRADDGRAVVVVCSVGIDVDFVPAAADARVAANADARLVLVVPEGDDHWVTHDLAGALSTPADVTTIKRDWAALL